MAHSRPSFRLVLMRGARALAPLALLASSGLGTVPALAATASAAGPLSVTISAPDNGVEGAAVPFTVIVTNNTADTTTALSQVDIDLSSNSQLSGGIANSTGGACNRRSSQFDTSIVCNLAGIPASGSATVTFSAVPLATGTLSATATAAFAVTLSQASINVAIGAAPTDVQVTGSASTGSPTVGSTYFYTFQVKDNGPWPAPGVTLSGTLPSVVSFVGANSTAGTCSATGGTVSCSFGDLQVGAQATATITVQAPATPQTFTDTASVSMNDTDRQPSNDSAGVTVQVR